LTLKPVCDSSFSGNILLSVPGEEYWKNLKAQLYNSRIDYSLVDFYRPNLEFIKKAINFDS